MAASLLPIVSVLSMMSSAKLATLSVEEGVRVWLVVLAAVLLSVVFAGCIPDRTGVREHRFDRLAHRRGRARTWSGVRGVPMAAVAVLAVRVGPGSLWSGTPPRCGP